MYYSEASEWEDQYSQSDAYSDSQYGYDSYYGHNSQQAGKEEDNVDKLAKQ